jgi:hypothetical protein
VEAEERLGRWDVVALAMDPRESWGLPGKAREGKSGGREEGLDRRGKRDWVVSDICGTQHAIYTSHREGPDESGRTYQPPDAPLFFPPLNEPADDPVTLPD